MLLGEPPRTQADLNFTLLGIPVRVHPFFWLMTFLLGMNILTDAVSVISWVAAVFIGILFHEMGHAMTMRAFSYYPWITLYGLGGLASCDQRYGSRGGTRQQILISLAGPAAGFLLAGLILLGVVLSGHGDTIDFNSLSNMVILPNEKLNILANNFLFVCFAWGILNLLPIYPLDGGQVAREILVHVNPHEGIRFSLQLSIAFAVGMAFYGFVQLHSLLIALMFGYLAYSSYMTLKFYRSPGRW